MVRNGHFLMRYWSRCGDPGCHTQGDSLDEVMDNIKEAIQLYLETLSPEERDEYLCREILTTSLEVGVA